MSPELERITQRAQAEPQARFTALAHHLSEEFLRDTWHRLNHRGAPGVDQQTVAAYAAGLDARLADLVARNKRRAYQAPPVRRVYIPKAGKPDQQRPLGIPTVEDRLLQAAVARLLSALYEADFLSASYGFRPGRNAHQALRDLRNTVMTGRAHWVVEADIRGYFDHIDHAWLLRMLALRIGDRWILRLIRKWLTAGVLEGTELTPTEAGTPQGGPLSPVLANVYLHYALDLWFQRVVQPRCRGAATLIRFADDFLALFERPDDANRFYRTLPHRLGKFGLTLAEEKTRVVPFGRAHWRAGHPYPEAFDFLGFRHHLSHDRRGRMAVVRVPSPKSRRKFLQDVKHWLSAHQHAPPREQRRTLEAKLRGFYQYFALPHTTASLGRVGYAVQWYWYRSLARRSQRGARWDDLKRHPWFGLPRPRVLHPTI